MVTKAPERIEIPTSDDRTVSLALKLQAYNPEHLQSVAGMIRKGRIVAFPFNGVFGLFGDIDSVSAAEAIIEAKARPGDRKLIAVGTPEAIDLHSDLTRTSYPKEQLIALLTDVHALGVILPALTDAPSHLTVGEGRNRTILTIWTEYPPLRAMVEHLYSLGGRGLVGTSANKFGEATHFDPEQLYPDFSSTSVQAVVYDRFDHLPLFRRMSTTIIDLTDDHPRLHREGSVCEDEARAALQKHGFPELLLKPDVIAVRGRTY